MFTFRNEKLIPKACPNISANKGYGMSSTGFTE